MARAKWVLLYRWELGQKVWVYEPLRANGLKLRLSEGWMIVP